MVGQGGSGFGASASYRSAVSSSRRSIDPVALGEQDAGVKVSQRTAGRSAIASGIVTSGAAVVLVVFFLVEAPALVETWPHRSGRS